MAPGSRLKDLRVRVAVLARRLPRPSPTGSYGPKQIDATLAFRLLAHAEIEACIEDLARDVVNGCYATFTQHGRVAIPVAALCATYGGKLLKVDRSASEPLSDIVNSSVSSHYQEIRNNHGIKEENVCKLLLPLGVKHSSLDPSWLANLTSFGSRRGDAAHRSYGSQIQPDPVQERLDVRRIVDGLTFVDGELRKLADSSLLW